LLRDGGSSKKIAERLSNDCVQKAKLEVLDFCAGLLVLGVGKESLEEMQAKGVKQMKDET
jgi:hypothetical protein